MLASRKTYLFYNLIKMYRPIAGILTIIPLTMRVWLFKIMEILCSRRADLQIYCGRYVRALKYQLDGEIEVVDEPVGIYC